MVEGELNAVDFNYGKTVIERLFEEASQMRTTFRKLVSLILVLCVLLTPVLSAMADENVENASEVVTQETPQEELKQDEPVEEKQIEEEPAEKKENPIQPTAQPQIEDDDLDFIEEFEEETEEPAQEALIEKETKEEMASEPAIVIPETRINSLKDVIQLIRDCSEKIENAGYRIDTEEIDLDDMYQVIFKINK